MGNYATVIFVRVIWDRGTGGRRGQGGIWGDRGRDKPQPLLYRGEGCAGSKHPLEQYRSRMKGSGRVSGQARMEGISDRPGQGQATAPTLLLLGTSVGGVE